MKRSTMIVLLVISVFLVAAGVLVAAGFGWNYSGSSFGTTSVGEYALTGLESIDVRLGAMDLQVYDGWDKTLEVEVSDSALDRVTVSLDGSTLTIREEERRAGLFRLFGRREEGHVILWLPKGGQGEFSASAGSGDITLSGVRCDEMEVRIGTASGDVDVYDSRVGALTAESSSGEIYLSGSEIYQSLTLNTASGDIYLYENEWPSLTAETSSGNVTLSGSEGETAEIKTGSGNVSVSEGELVSLTVSTGSGDLSLWEADAAAIRFDASSGDISGTLTGSAADYTVRFSSSSGRSNLASGGSGPRSLEISTSSGDADLDFAG